MPPIEIEDVFRTYTADAINIRTDTADNTAITGTARDTAETNATTTTTTYTLGTDWTVSYQDYLNTHRPILNTNDFITRDQFSLYLARIYDVIAEHCIIDISQEEFMKLIRG